MTVPEFSPPPRVFVISPRVHDPESAWARTASTIRLAAKHGFTGVLAHTGNDTLVDPWVVGQQVLEHSRELVPLIAVNPVYQHPFGAAHLVSSLAYRYDRPVFLNLVAGTSTADRIALGDQVPHDARYARLREFGEVLSALLDGGRPVTYDGEFYRLTGARLALPCPARLRPTAFIAGQSSAADECAAALAATRIRMFERQPAVGPAGHGCYAGLIVRDTDAQAWQVAARRYPVDRDLEDTAVAALRYTDAVWKRRLVGAAHADNRADRADNRADNQAGGPDGEPPDCYWTYPARSFRADCPFLVGSVATVAQALAAHLAAGATDLIVDLAPEDADFRHAARALQAARRIAATPAAPAGSLIPVQHGLGQGG